jgi:1,4-alpha-glucan branching enzyme
VTSTPALDGPLEHLLAAWMPQQRWYPAKGRGVGIRGLGVVPLDQPAADVAIEVHVVGLDSGDRLDVVQVPLAFRPGPLDGADAALVGVLDRADLGRCWVYDGPHDPVYVSALLRSLVAAPGAVRPAPESSATVLGGEQSNTSVVVAAGTPEASIVKVFRTLHAGANPDVEVASALSTSGCDRVPAVRGWLEGSWTAPDGTPATGHLAVAAEFLAGSQDAWREAVAAVRSGNDFADRARDLGAATASVHVALVDAFGHTPMSDDEHERLVAGLRQRIDWAMSSVPDLLPLTGALTDHAARLSELTDLPDLQRIHGDYHLGQVLHSPARGWVLLDFEGEPLRPLSERTQPDLSLRDVAGMLRSFDYAARFTTIGHDDPAAVAAADAWAASARRGFISGYAEAGADDPHHRSELLAALELDKALYEVVYEARNRPQWLPVPLHAVRRLVPA